MVDNHTAVRWAVARRWALLMPKAHVAVLHARGEANAAPSLLVVKRMREAVVSCPNLLSGGPRQPARP